MGGEAEVVQAAGTRRLQAGGRLAGDAAGLLGGQAALLEDLGEGVGLGDRLLDVEGGAVGSPHVEHPHQSVVVEAGHAAGGVEGGRGVWLVLAEADHDHVALEGGVMGRPAFGVRQRLEPAPDGIAAAQHRRRPYPVHAVSSCVAGAVAGPVAAALRCHPRVWFAHAGRRRSRRTTGSNSCPTSSTRIECARPKTKAR